MMRAAIFDKPGIENLKVIDNAEKPKLANPDYVLIKVKVAGVNPIDNRVVSGSIQTIRPIPHIPGAEVSGHIYILLTPCRIRLTCAMDCY